MRTVRSLIEELQRFPDDAPCYAYEGEATGIVVGVWRKDFSQGFIHCFDSKDEDPSTELGGFATLEVRRMPDDGGASGQMQG